jgi:hypothetical protein
MTAFRFRGRPGSSVGSRLRASLVAAVALGLLLAGPALSSARAAEPAPAWTVRGVALPTEFNPTLTDNRYEFIVLNSGDATSEPGLTLTDELPAGLTMTGIEAPTGLEGGEWTCAEPGPSLVSCSFSEELRKGAYSVPLEIKLSTPAESALPLENRVTVSGAGALVPATATQRTSVGTAPQSFGVAEFDVEAHNALGEPETRAGAHPWQVTTSLAVPLTNASTGPNQQDHYQPLGNLKRVAVELPLGLVGDPFASEEKCTGLQLLAGACPRGSRVGSLAVGAGAFEYAGIQFFEKVASNPDELGLYNMATEPGYPAQLGLTYLHQPIYLDATVVHSAAGERLRLATVSIPEKLEVTDAIVTVYGEPGQLNFTSPETAFLTNPTDCAAAATPARVEIESWSNPGHTVSAESFPYSQLEGCNELDFEPSLSLLPETGAADSPSGMNVDLAVPQTSLFEERATPQLRDATVTLPEGLVADPALADGLQGCAATGPEGINLGSSQLGIFGSDLGNPFATELGAGHLGGDGSPYDDGLYHTAPGHCPGASTLGTATVETPVLPEPLEGHVYLGTPECSPCTNQDAEAGKLIKLYIEAAGDGVIVKLPGTVSADPVTGRLTASFRENPQLPFEHLQLHFRPGPRAALSTPPTCGTYATTSDLKPWSAPETPDATPTSSFKVTSGPGGGTCANSAAQEPDKPAFTAGSTNPSAGAYSPFALKLSREDGSQRLKALNVTLPAGLTAKLAGVAECSEAQIAAAAASSGTAQKASPSCPLASELGTVNVGAGAGPNPFYVQGHAYLAGPYKGAPLSMAILTPALAGPFDLGTVVVRVALYVNPETAQIHAVSDPIPQILAGIPLDVRSISLNVSRNQFTLNPTSCDPTAVAATVLAASSEATLSSPFQVGGCSALGFKPKVAIDLKGATKRNKNPALKATVTYPQQGNYANIAKASVALPHSEFLDQAHIKTICTRVQFAEGQTPGEKCPKASIYGFAKATTPLLEKPVEGPVYLRSSSNKLPDLVAALNGQIDVDLDGRIDTDKQDGIRNSFEVVPDAPVTKFVLEMQGGKKGLLVNSEDICRKPQKATVKLTAQNGKTYDTSPVIANSCGKGKKHHKHGGGR